VQAIQKIVKNGSSWQITLPRPLLFALNLVPGEFVKVWTTDDGVAHFKKFSTDDQVSRLSPGIINDPRKAVTG
jgi:antitoxin component of MazEF toxin-antitoxin module